MLPPVSSSAKIAQASPSGTVAITMSAAIKLSNWADSTKNTTAIANPKVRNNPFEFSVRVAASPKGCTRLSGGKISAAMVFSCSNASPNAKSSVRPAVIGTERICASRFSSGATARSSNDTKDEIGTILPSRLCTNSRSKSPGSFTGCAVETILISKLRSSTKIVPTDRPSRTACIASPKPSILMPRSAARLRSTVMNN